MTIKLKKITLKSNELRLEATTSFGSLGFFCVSATVSGVKLSVICIVFYFTLLLLEQFRLPHLLQQFEAELSVLEAPFP